MRPRCGPVVRDQHAAERFLRQVIDSVGCEPRVVITDKLARYPPAIKRLPPGRGDTGADFVDVLRAYQARSAQVRAATSASALQGTWGGLLAYLAEHEDALTPEFARDLAEVHSLVKTPAASVDPWQL